MTILDHSYPLAPSWVSPVNVQPDGRLEAVVPGELANHTLLLEFGDGATHKRRQGGIGIVGDGVSQEQLLEANARGRSFLDPTGLTRLGDIPRPGRDCASPASARLLA